MRDPPLRFQLLLNQRRIDSWKLKLYPVVKQLAAAGIAHQLQHSFLALANKLFCRNSA